MRGPIELVVSTIAILCMTVVELMAIRARIDGVALNAYMVAMAGLGGYHLHAYLTRRPGPPPPP